MPALAAAGPAEGVKVIEAKVLEVPALANAMGPMKDLDQGEIVDPGASSIIGQTPHRSGDMPINIDRNECAQKATDSITPGNLQTGKASV